MGVEVYIVIDVVQVVVWIVGVVYDFDVVDFQWEQYVDEMLVVVVDVVGYVVD